MASFPSFSQHLRRSAWVIWLVGVGVYFFAVLHRASLGVAGPQAVDRLNISSTQLGSFIMVQLGLYAFMQVPSGILIDRFGPRRMLLAATLLMGSAQILFAFSTNFPMALTARAALGIGDSAVYISVLRLASGWFPRRRYAVLTMATSLVGMCGNLVATVPLVVFLGNFGWTKTFAITGALSAAYALLLLRPAVARSHTDATRGRTERSQPGPKPGAVARAKLAWGQRETQLGFWTHQGTATAGTVISLVWGYPYLKEGLGFSDELAATQLSIYVIANVIANFFIGPLAGRKPQWRTAMALAVSSLCVLAVAVLVAWPGGRPPLAVVTAAFILFSFGPPASQIGFHLARDYNPPQRISTATGLVNAGGFSGAMVAAIVVGIVLDISSGGGAKTLTDYRWALSSIALLGLLSTTALTVVLLRVRADTLAKMRRDEEVVVQLRERAWDRAWKRRR